MKQIVIIIFSLVTFSCAIFGQQNLSNDVVEYINNEEKYNAQSKGIVKDILKAHNESLIVEQDYFKIIPTFKSDKDYLISGDIDSFMSSLKIDKNILWDEILINHQPNKKFKYFVGWTFCKLDSCKVYLFEDDYALHDKYDKATEEYVFKGDYELIFKIENYPDFWFLWKDNQLSLYSFKNETLYTDKELQSYFKSNSTK